MLELMNFLLRQQRNILNGQEILYTWGRGYYHICSRQPTVGLFVSKIKQNIFSAQTVTFYWIDNFTSDRSPSPVLRFTWPGYQENIKTFAGMM
jgi:hypothetical protein